MRSLENSPELWSGRGGSKIVFGFPVHQKIHFRTPVVDDDEGGVFDVLSKSPMSERAVAYAKRQNHSRPHRPVQP